MYRAVHNTAKGKWEVVDAEGSWVAGPWLKMHIARAFAKSLNMAESELIKEEQQGEAQE